MANDPRRTPHGSSDAVLAEAQRIAADIRRRAEREANAVRREAAEWASTTRREADRYRERVLAELEHARAVTDLPSADDEPETEVVSDPPPAEAADLRPVVTPVIDLRTAAAARQDERSHQDDEELDEIEAESDEVGDEDDIEEDLVLELHHRPAVGGTYVVGRPLPAPGTSIETKVHDVVRLAVRRTFHRRFP